MQIKKRNNLSLNRSRTSPGGAGGDFSSILDESPWERFTDKIKPLIKVLLVLVIIGGAIYGGILLFGSKANEKPAEYAGGKTTVSQDDDKLKLYQCLDDMAKINPSPETSDPEFFKKLIDSYDKRLSCYDKYPSIDLAGKSQMEENRKSAIDSSGAYKDTYLESGGTYDYTPSSSYHTQGNVSANTGTDDSSSSAPNPTPPSSTANTIDVAWCSNKKAEVDSLYSQYQSARSSADAVRSELSSVGYSRPPGFTGTQSQLDAWRASEKQKLQNELSPLQSAEREAQQKYNTAQSEYRAKGCY